MTADRRRGVARRFAAWAGAGLALLLGTLPAAPLRAADTTSMPLLGAIFRDHAVLQRDRPIRVWGRASPGADVQLSLDAHRVRARADRDGRWDAQLPALPAGGPHVLTARSGDRTQTVADLLVGDVWLCSGQSNMELPVWRSLDAASELRGASAPTVRLLTVPQAASALPLDTFAGPAPWRRVDADSLRDFSAACFYFARELQKTVDVPMGLVSAAWGGSRIEAWMDADAVRAGGRHDAALDVLALSARDPVAAAARWGELWARWWDANAATTPADQPWRSPDATRTPWREAPAALGAWERWGDPALSSYNGMVWYRTEVTLSAMQAAQDAVLELGAVDETDVTWVNGRAVGSRYDPGAARRYPLPRRLLRAGANEIVINVLDTYGDGGMAAPASAYRLRLGDGSSVALGPWRYRQAAVAASPPGAPWQSAAGLTTLSNGMIAPLGRYGLRGILWYQGESNTGEADRYPALLRGLAADWRARFGRDTPLLVVQLAGYGAPPTAPGESGWASLREAQRQVVAADPHAALAVTIDIGDRYDIHPPNKQELGRRLARAARALVYGDAMPASGPVPRTVAREGAAVLVQFADAGNGLVAYGASGPVGFELCTDAPGSCRYADALIRGDAVVLQAALAAPATRVRYGWADKPVVTLFDGTGLPAGPFQLPIPRQEGTAP